MTVASFPGELDRLLAVVPQRRQHLVALVIKSGEGARITTLGELRVDLVANGLEVLARKIPHASRPGFVLAFVVAEEGVSLVSLRYSDERIAQLRRAADRSRCSSLSPSTAGEKPASRRLVHALV